MSFRTFQAYLDNIRLINLQLPIIYDAKDLSFTLESDDQVIPLTIQTCKSSTEHCLYSLTLEEDIDLEQHYLVYDQDRNKTVLAFRHIVQEPIFDQTFDYDQDDLGATYSSKATSFAFWAPISEQVLIKLKKDGKETVWPLLRQEKGVWKTTIPGDWERASYTYLHKVNGPWLEVHDPYALSSEANSGASFIIDPKKLLNTTGVKRAKTQLSPTKAVIYEMSVRDFSSQKDAGFKEPSTFRALTESPKLGKRKIGMQHLLDLGITHIQLMPVYDFGSVDEKHPEQVYNWGYDPVQYNVPEGSFASDPEDPYARILELQETIATYHEADMSLIMDVVYNHVYDADSFAFEKIVPGYFYRLNEQKQRTDGTFCGNDVASERAMVRRFIKHSVKQWVNLYGFDGFRFDLMGILDIQTMNELAEELKESYPNVYLYGEGWKMATGLDSELLAHQYNAAELTDYGFFSDNFRDTIKGTILNKQRLTGFEWTSSMANILTANVGLETASHFQSPQQAINYTECHDNATVFDYFKMEDPNISPKERLASARLALHLVLLAQGVPFLHSGQEFFRHKDLLDNSYNIPDTINRLDWQSLLNYEEDVDFIRELISFRKEHPLLSLESREEILEACQVEWLNDSLVRYQISQQDEQMTILINFGSKDQTYQNELGQEVFLSYPAISSDKAIAPLADNYVIPAKQVLVLK